MGKWERLFGKPAPPAPARPLPPPVPARPLLPPPLLPKPGQPLLPPAPTRPLLPAAPAHPQLPAAPTRPLPLHPLVAALHPNPPAPYAPKPAQLPAAPERPQLPAAPERPQLPAAPGRPQLPADAGRLASGTAGATLLGANVWACLAEGRSTADCLRELGSSAVKGTITAAVVTAITGPIAAGAILAALTAKGAADTGTRLGSTPAVRAEAGQAAQLDKELAFARQQIDALIALRGKITKDLETLSCGMAPQFIADMTNVALEVKNHTLKITRLFDTGGAA